MMASRVLRSEAGAKHGRLYRMSEHAFDALLNAYHRTLDKALAHRRITLAVFFATLVATGYVFVTIPKGFFPQQDTGFVFGTSEAAQDISFADMRQHQLALAKIVMQDPAVANVLMSIGSGGGQTQNNGRMFIALKPRNQRDVSADQVIRRIQPKLAQVEGAALFLQVAQDINVGGRLSRTQYQYTLQDADLNELNEWAPKLQAKMKTLPALRDVATDQQTGGATWTVSIDRDQASRFGIDPQMIDVTLNDAYGQRQVAQYFTQLNSYHVVMEVTPGQAASPRDLNGLYLHSPTTGQQVPLASLVKWTTMPTAFLSINHQAQFPAITLSFNLAPGAALSQATAAITAAQAQMNMPSTVIGTFQGNAQAFQTSLASEPYLIAAAIVVIYIILGVLYESYIHPLTILSTLPSAALGALATLMIFGFDFSLIALIGVLLLIGIVKKNGIMLVDFAIEAERHRGLNAVDSVREACLLRFRPIIMTTMAAMLGGVPLMIGTGTGSEIRQPLGFAIVGGLIVSQALTLYTTPVVYIYLDQLGAWFRRRRSGGALAEGPAHAPAE
jgi:multidrug efflux pump subunit AcrB